MTKPGKVGLGADDKANTPHSIIPTVHIPHQKLPQSKCPFQKLVGRPPNGFGIAAIHAAIAQDINERKV